MHWLSDSVTHWFIDSMIDPRVHWFIGLLVQWSTDSSIHRFIGSSSLTCWLVGWLTDWLIDWLIGWLIDWLLDSLVRWLAVSLIHWFMEFIDPLIDPLNHRFTESLLHCFIVSLIHWFIDSLLNSSVDSVADCFDAALVHWLLDSLIGCFVVIVWFIESSLCSFSHSLIHRLIGSLIQPVTCALFFQCHFIGISTTIFASSLMHLTTTSLLLHLRNLSRGKFLPVIVLFFQNFHPGAGRALCGRTTVRTVPAFVDLEPTEDSLEVESRWVLWISCSWFAFFWRRSCLLYAAMSRDKVWWGARSPRACSW